MLHKAHVTSYSRMSGSRWVITPLWLSGSWRSFLYNSSVYSCHLFLISSPSVRSIPFLSFIEPIFAWNVPGISNFLEEISGLSHSIVFLYFFAFAALNSKLHKNKDILLQCSPNVWNDAWRVLEAWSTSVKDSIFAAAIAEPHWASHSCSISAIHELLSNPHSSDVHT